MMKSESFPWLRATRAANDDSRPMGPASVCLHARMRERILRTA